MFISLISELKPIRRERQRQRLGRTIYQSCLDYSYVNFSDIKRFHSFNKGVVKINYTRKIKCEVPNTT